VLLLLAMPSVPWVALNALVAHRPCRGGLAAQGLYAMGTRADLAESIQAPDPA